MRAIEIQLPKPYSLVYEDIVDGVPADGQKISKIIIGSTQMANFVYAQENDGGQGEHIPGTGGGVDEDGNPINPAGHYLGFGQIDPTQESAGDTTTEFKSPDLEIITGELKVDGSDNNTFRLHINTSDLTTGNTQGQKFVMDPEDNELEIDSFEGFQDGIVMRIRELDYCDDDGNRKKILVLASQSYTVENR